MSFVRIDDRYKVSESPSHIFFLTGPCSQWHPSPFRQRILRNTDLTEFNCAEQYMMAMKAFTFGDAEALDGIMTTNDPRKQKAFGRAVKNFDAEVWNRKVRKIVLAANLAKFTQNEELASYLLSFDRQKSFVEGAHYDPIWGVGLAWDNPAIIDPANWKGHNWLGKTLDIVRQFLISYPSFDLLSDD